VSVLGAHWFPNDDQAIQVLRVSDVGTVHTPLLGAWSRWAWNHPGPMQPWLTAPLYHLFGNDGVLVSSALFAAASCAGAAWVGLRRGGVVLGALVAAVVCLLCGALGLSTLVDPWNPYVALLPFLLFLLLIWAAASDDLAMLPLAAAVGTFCVQAHVGYTVLVGGMGAFACAVVIGRRALELRQSRRGVVRADTTSSESPLPARRSGTSDETAPPPSDETAPPLGDESAAALVERSALRRTAIAFAASVFVALLLWAPAIIDELWGSHNVSTLVRFSTHPSEPLTGWRAAAGIMSAQLGVPPGWVDANDTLLIGLPRTAPIFVGVIAVGVVATVGVLTARARRAGASLMAWTSLAAVLAALVSTARLAGTRYPYLVRWWWLVAAMCWLSVAWGVLVLLRAERRRSIAVVAVLVAGALTVGVAVRDVPVSVPNATSSAAMAHLLGPTGEHLDPDGRYVIRAKDELNLFGAGRGLMLGLEKAGFHVYVEPDELSSHQVGSWRSLPLADADGVVFIVGLDSLDAGFRPNPAAKRIAVYDPLTPAERKEFAALQAEVRAALGPDAGDGVIGITSPFLAKKAIDDGVPAADVRRMAELQSRGSGFAVYLEPTDAA